MKVKFSHNSEILCRWYQDQIDSAVKQLLALKAEFKKITGQDYKPGMGTPTSSAATTVTSSFSSSLSSSTGLYERVAQQGEVVRKLKSEKAPKVFRYTVLSSVKKKK